MKLIDRAWLLIVFCGLPFAAAVMWATEQDGPGYAALLGVLGRSWLDEWKEIGT